MIDRVKVENEGKRLEYKLEVLFEKDLSLF
jgi:hypothetical protein